jgi:vitamin K-dependent gamma-carboxylase
MLDRLLFKRIDNSPLIIFRIFFGFLVACESFGAIATGWVHRNLVEPRFNFPFIDFDWLQPLPGYGMYVYFSIMGLLGICIAFGYKYRFSIILFTLLWTAVYLMQKTAYNNHYYLLVLLSLFMCFAPADKNYTIAIKRNPQQQSDTMYSYVKWIIILQLFIVYVYASIAKLYGDWLDFGMIRILMRPVAHYPLIGELLQQEWTHKIIGTAGILFDLLIIPALLWTRTRKLAFYLSIFFHLFNSIVFQIGIFPYLSLAFSVFFFEPETIRSIFFKKKKGHIGNEVKVPKHRNIILPLLSSYFIIQLLLPLRHHFISDNILWTEEGHRLSWRMMLRSRSGKGEFKVVNNQTGEKIIIEPKKFLSNSQQRKVFAYPDFAWQFAGYLQQEYAQNGENISVYLEQSRLSINGKPYASFIDPKTDLANTPWLRFKHHEWIFPSALEGK